MGHEREIDPTAAAAERTALAAVLPLWMGAALTDYVLHRRSKIESTSGLFEARLHVGGIALTMPSVLAALLLEIDAGALAIMGFGYLTHAGMTIWDIAYADERRRIVPFEQHVHALLEVLPLTALALVTLAHREQALALVGRGASKPRFALRFKRTPLPPAILALTSGVFALGVALPYAEEYLRCLRHARKRPILGANAPSQHQKVEAAEQDRVPG